MDIIGAPYWSENYYSQENNPTERYNQARGLRIWLEGCGPTAGLNCLTAKGRDIEVKCPGTYDPQPEAVLMDCFNDPRNEKKFREIRDLGDYDVPFNRVPQYYPLAVNMVFGAEAEFSFGARFEQIVEHLEDTNPVQLCLKNPGHYIAVVAYDRDTDQLIYHDSWGKRFSDGRGGKSRRMDRAEVEMNVKPFRIVYTA